jgi:rubredoxin-NAD+ reductase
MPPIVIIGTGLAGYTLAREIRKRDTRVAVCLISQDDGAFYSKPMLSNALGKDKSADDLATADADRMRSDLAAEILTHTRVTAINVNEQKLELANGEVVDYGRLVLAVGAQALAPPLQGEGVASVCTVNSLDDYRRFRQCIAGKRSVAIIGPGLIGCEFANDLVSAGYEVHVIGPGAWPLGGLLPARAGAALQTALQAIGVQWHLQCTATQVVALNDRLRLTLDNDTQLDVDVVLSAIGLRPNTVLAQAAGLRVNRGIVVDRTLQTSCANVYALGDCAEVGGVVLPFVMPLMQQARALAATLCGETSEVNYPAMPVLVKTTTYPVVVSPPPLHAQGAWQEEARDGGVRALFKADDRLLGFALTGTTVSEKQALTKLLSRS